MWFKVCEKKNLKIYNKSSTVFFQNLFLSIMMNKVIQFFWLIRLHENTSVGKLFLIFSFCCYLIHTDVKSKKKYKSRCRKDKVDTFDRLFVLLGFKDFILLWHLHIIYNAVIFFAYFLFTPPAPPCDTLPSPTADSLSNLLKTK